MEKKSVPVLVRMPPALARKLEATAKSQHRSRNAEAVLRLADSFKKRLKSHGAMVEQSSARSN